MKSIFDETMLGGIPLKNRVFRSATWMAMADGQGRVTDGLVSVYRQLAEGGVGAIVTGITSVAPADAPLEGIARFYDDSFIAGHRRITDAVHESGAIVYLQTAMVASCMGTPQGVVSMPVNAWSVEEGRQIVSWFGDAAARAERAGYDGVQIHAAHGFFLSRFISPRFNQRDDEYGGDARRRARILVDILRDMRAKASPGFSIIAKINASDEMPYGLTVEDFLVASEMLVEAGIDAIEVSANGTSRQGVKPGQNEAYFRGYALALKECVDVPVILVGGHRSLACMNEVINEIGIEYLALSRPLICEPDLLTRWQTGDTSPSKCMSCNACYGTPRHQCIFNMRRGQ